MNRAIPKSKTGKFDLTACIYTIFSIALSFLLSIARGPGRIKPRVFQVKVSISVKPRLTFLPVPLASSIFPATSLPNIRNTTYDVPSSTFPPSCTPTTPYCAAVPPFYAATTPSNAATTHWGTGIPACHLIITIHFFNLFILDKDCRQC